MLTSNKNSCFSCNKTFYIKLLLQNNKTHVKDDLTITRSITYCIENKTSNEMKNNQVQH